MLLANTFHQYYSVFCTLQKLLIRAESNIISLLHRSRKDEKLQFSDLHTLLMKGSLVTLACSILRMQNNIS